MPLSPCEPYSGNCNFIYKLNDPITSWGSFILDHYLKGSSDISLVQDGWKCANPGIGDDANWRNILFAEGINTIEDGKSAVVLLGWFHFYSDKGVLNLLKEKGWSLSRVPCRAWSSTPTATEEHSSSVLQKLFDILKQERTPTPLTQYEKFQVKMLQQGI